MAASQMESLCPQVPNYFKIPHSTYTVQLTLVLFTCTYVGGHPFSLYLNVPPFDAPIWLHRISHVFPHSFDQAKTNYYTNLPLISDGVNITCIAQDLVFSHAHLGLYIATAVIFI